MEGERERKKEREYFLACMQCHNMIAHESQTDKQEENQVGLIPTYH